jgi:hypothetical protein
MTPMQAKISLGSHTPLPGAVEHLSSKKNDPEVFAQ